MDVKVRANGDDAFVAWTITRRIPECRGFALYRRRNGSEEIVRTWVGFEGDSSKPGERRSSTEWPIQKLQWIDYMANPGDELQYRVVPMVGPDKHSLTAANDLASAWTASRKLTAACDGDFCCYFNRGIVAAQWVQRRLGLGAFDQRQQRLSKIIETPGDETRGFMMGELGKKLVELLRKTNADGGHVYAALFELNDPELVPLLAKFKKRAHVVLANASAKKKGDDPNHEARATLKGVDLHDRMCAPRALGHNKFLVLCDANKKPLMVWTGSTNWSITGLCTQANNAITIEDAKVAKAYVAEWERLRDAGDASPAELKTAHGAAIAFGKNSLWYSPKAKGKAGDLDELKDIVDGAQEGILFLMFNPGPRNSALNSIIDASRVKESRRRYVIGVVNQDPSTKVTKVELFARGNREYADYEVVLPEAIDERLAFWVSEIKKKDKAFAMVHSKVIVVDPFGKKPVVVTGSHNLGPKASGTNDENLVIIRNAPELAEAYAVNVMSVYLQYRWRFMRRNQTKTGAMKTGHRWNGLQDNDTWQDDYLSGAKKREADFWLGE